MFLRWIFWINTFIGIVYVAFIMVPEVSILCLLINNWFKTNATSTFVRFFWTNEIWTTLEDCERSKKTWTNHFWPPSVKSMNSTWVCTSVPIPSVSQRSDRQLKTIFGLKNRVFSNFHPFSMATTTRTKLLPTTVRISNVDPVLEILFNEFFLHCVCVGRPLNLDEFYYPLPLTYFVITLLLFAFSFLIILRKWVSHTCVRFLNFISLKKYFQLSVCRSEWLKTPASNESEPKTMNSSSAWNCSPAGITWLATVRQHTTRWAKFCQPVGNY